MALWQQIHCISFYLQFCLSQAPPGFSGSRSQAWRNSLQELLDPGVAQCASLRHTVCFTGLSHKTIASCDAVSSCALLSHQLQPPSCDCFKGWLFQHFLKQKWKHFFYPKTLGLISSPLHFKKKKKTSAFLDSVQVFAKIADKEMVTQSYEFPEIHKSVGR